MLHLTVKPIELKLTTPFRIARSVQHTAPNMIVQLTHNEFTGYGEAAPCSYYGETSETVRACFSLLADHLGDDPFLIDDLHARLNSVIRFNPSVKAAIDMAFYDLMGKMLGIPLYKLLGLNPEHTPYTSFTIGIDSPQEMAKKALLAKDYPILKIKVGTRHDLDIIKAIRDVSAATLRVDANAGWTPKEAIKNITAFEPYNIEFVEQPVPAYDLAGLKLIRDNVPLPIIADESCMTIEDIPRLSECVDGINFKLMKNGGIRTIFQMIQVARAYHLRVMLGCFIESSLAITAAAHLTPLVDYADLDGNLLIDNDPYQGVRVEKGKLVLPDGPGLGVTAC